MKISIVDGNPEEFLINLNKDELEVLQLATLEYRDRHALQIIQSKKEIGVCAALFLVMDHALDNSEKMIENGKKE